MVSVVLRSHEVETVLKVKWRSLLRKIKKEKTRKTWKIKENEEYDIFQF